MKDLLIKFDDLEIRINGQWLILYKNNQIVAVNKDINTKRFVNFLYKKIRYLLKVSNKK